MDESSFIDEIRAGADGIGTQDSDVDALVRGAVVQGRRRRTRRRAGAVLGPVVAAAVVVTVVATGVVPVRLGSPPPGPVATPAVATPAPSPNESSSSATASPRQTTGKLSGTPAQVQATLVSLMPASTTVTRAVSDSTTDAEGREHNAYLDLRDAKGTSSVAAGIGSGHRPVSCSASDHCVGATLAGGGRLFLTRSPAGDKAGQDQSAFYDRPDGGHLWLTQTNDVDGNGPVTRKGLPLSTDQVSRLMTSPTLDRLFRG